MSSQPLYLTSCSLYLFHHIHSIDDITTICISEITSAIVHNIISILYDMTHHIHFIRHFIRHGSICTVYDISPTIYDISTLYPIHQSVISHIKLNISDNTSTASLYSHPDYLSYNPHCVYDNTGTICKTSCEYI